MYVNKKIAFALILFFHALGIASGKKCIEAGQFHDLIRDSHWGSHKKNQAVSNELRERLHAVNPKIDIGNVGITKGTINGKEVNLVAHNGVESVRGTLPPAMEKSRQFSYQHTAERATDALRRANDAEAKIFEYLAGQYKPGSKGQLTLYSEKPLCFSCQRVLNQFKAKYPGIDIEVKVHKPQ